MKNSPRRINNWKKERKSAIYDKVEHKYFIFCEGEKTEPNYFEAFKSLIEKNPIYRNIIQIEIKGTGMNTLSIFEFAEKYVETNSIEKAKIWCIYDKDSFPPEKFNAVEQKSKSLNNKPKNVEKELTYHVGWSNQCIEYWFILHFVYYDTDNDREYYIEYLNNKFMKLKVEKYAKNSKDIFEILYRYGNPKLAIRHAKKRIEESRGRTPADSAPATKVYELVVELSKYLPKEVATKFGVL